MQGVGLHAASGGEPPRPRPCMPNCMMALHLTRGLLVSTYHPPVQVPHLFMGVTTASAMTLNSVLSLCSIAMA